MTQKEIEQELEKLYNAVRTQERIITQIKIGELLERIRND